MRSTRSISPVQPPSITLGPTFNEPLPKSSSNTLPVRSSRDAFSSWAAGPGFSRPNCWSPSLMRRSMPLTFPPR